MATRIQSGKTAGAGAPRSKPEVTAQASLPSTQPAAAPISAGWVRGKSAAGATQAVASVKMPTLPAGYSGFQVKAARVLNASPSQQAKGNTPSPVPGSADSLDKAKVGLPQVDLVVNGTFNVSSKSGNRDASAGTIMRNGRLDASGIEKTRGRGAVAVLDNGKLVVLRQGGGGTAAEIQSQVAAQFGSKAKDFMGGGALLIENGKKVSSEDLLTKQKFDQGEGGGINAQQMRRSDHTVVAQDKTGATYVVVAKDKTGAEIQEELFKAGFTNAVKFDGSSGFVATTPQGNVDGRYQGSNYTGLAVDVGP
jgi:hypothetical protein